MKTFVVTSKIEVPHLTEDRVRWYESVVLAKDAAAAKQAVQRHYEACEFIIHKIEASSDIPGPILTHNRQY